MDELEQAKKQYEKEIVEFVAKIKERGLSDEELLALPGKIFDELKRQDSLN